MQTDSAPLPAADQAATLDTDTLPSLPLLLLAVERDRAAELKLSDPELEATSDEAPEDLDEEFKPKRGRGKAAGKAKAPANKKRKTNDEATAALKKRKGARLGRLEAMLQSLPVEILGEILSHLPPQMLIRLSRMAKVFRSLLMSKTSRVIWRRAFVNDGIGELEAPDLSEPKLASLIWDKECEMCGRQKVHKICYALRKRVCDPCLKASLNTPQQISAEHPDLHPDVYKCCPFTDTPPCRGGNWPGVFGHNSGLQLFLVPVVLAESANLTELAQRDRLNELLGGETEASQVQAHVKHCEELLPKAAKDAKMLQAWQLDHDGSRSNNKRQLRQERAATIRKHCEVAGYNPVDIHVGLSHTSEVYSLVDQPYALTDRVWRKISVTIFAHLDKVHQLRLDAEARRLVEEQRRREMEEELRQQQARRLSEIVERMRARLTSSGYGVGHGQQQQQQGEPQGVGPSFGGAGAGGGYTYGAGAGLDLGRPLSPEERALLLVQQIVERAPTTGFTLADLQILEGAMAMLPDPAGFPPNAASGDDGAGARGWF